MAAPRSGSSAGSASRGFVVRDVEGRRIDLSDGRRKAVALVFTGRDCPISNAYAAQVSRLGAEFAGRGILLCLVYPEAGLSVAQAKRHAKEFGYGCPLVLDGAHRLVKRAQVSITPEAAVIAPSGKILYRGRIDDRYASLGKPRLKATRQDLRLALEAVASGRPVQVARTEATGCYIEGVESTEGKAWAESAPQEAK